MSMPIAEGEVFAGKYRVERVLGQGGMGIVVAARHLQLGQLVAVKFLLPEAANEPEVLERFRRESRAAVQIQSQHVARVLDVGELEDGLPYMVMEHLQGNDLADVIEKRGPLPVAEAVGHLLQACEAIAEAHVLGIVHRDLKPANLFLANRTDGTAIIKVLDFGISKATQPGFAEDPALTRPAVVMGSPLYMPPEQLKSARDVDMRSDIWAIGVILYELLTGEPVFTGDTLPQLCAQILTEKPRPMASLRKGVPPGLEQVILRCLQKKPDQRFGNIGELARALVPFGPDYGHLSSDRVSRILAKANISDHPPAPSRVGQGVHEGALARSLTNAQAFSKARRNVVGGLVAGAVVLLALGGLWVRRSVPANAGLHASEPHTGTSLAATSVVPLTPALPTTDDAPDAGPAVPHIAPVDDIPSVHPTTDMASKAKTLSLSHSSPVASHKTPSGAPHLPPETKAAQATPTESTPSEGKNPLHVEIK